MAEGLLRSIAGEAMIPVSAAIEPAPVSPLAAYAVGLGDQSKERCPVFPFAFRIFRWSLEDPTAAEGSREERLDAFRRVRNQIDHNVREFLSQISRENIQPLATR